MKHLLQSLIFAALALLSMAANAVVLTLDSNNKLIGATDVMVNGTAYDVQFKDGKCSDLYGGCDADSDFIFNTQVTARDASLALMDQVFNAFPTYDLDPSLTNGCPPNFYSNYFGQTMGTCFIMTPFKVMPMLSSAELQVATFLALNDMRDFYDAVPALNNNYIMTQFADTNSGSQNPIHIYAVWAAADQADNSVPEPASLALIGLGFSLLRWSTRRALRPRSDR